MNVCRACSVSHSVGCPACKGYGTRAGRAISAAEAADGAPSERCIVCTANVHGVAPEPASLVGNCEQNAAPDRPKLAKRKAS